MRILVASKYVRLAVYSMLFLLYCYAGCKIAVNFRLFIVSIWLLFMLSIVLHLVYSGGDTYAWDMNLCQQADIEWLWPDLVENAAELVGILGLWTFAYHYFCTTLAVREIQTFGIDHYHNKPHYKKWAIYWIYFTLIVCMYIPLLMRRLEYWLKKEEYQMSVKISNNFIIIVVLVIALCKIKNLLFYVPQAT